jgi:hypothetical protein
MKTLLTILMLFLFQITGAHTFKSHETIMSIKDSADIKTKTIFWWSDWCYTLPADGSHQAIKVYKKKIIFERGDVYTITRSYFFKRRTVLDEGERGAIFVSDAIDQDGKKWTVVICRTDNRIRAIQFEDGVKMICYQ